ncbi:MAG TPA: 2OG-Fe(II) oxygenase family protein [Allosphingosinicella sp.]|nr:2OG-Fe(II) oxygenase family protein [Allosphingosinicella sp.]
MAQLPLLQRLFATPLLVDKIDDPQFIAALEEIILKRRAEDPGIMRSNTGGGWHSDVRLVQWGGAPATRLIEHVVGLVNSATTESGVKEGAPLRWAIDAWANVNEKGGANARHIHGGCYWSAVYYVRVDEGSGGQLCLYDPRMPMLAMHAPRLRFKVPGGEREVRIKPMSGRLIVFPAWLAHEVEPSTGDGLRISIAINLSHPKQQAVGALKRGGPDAKPRAIAELTKDQI